MIVGYVPKFLRRRTVDAVIEQAPHAEFFDVSARPDSYYEMFRRVWADAQDFVLIEHDIVIRPGTIEALDACPEPWCACPIGVEAKRSGRDEAYFQCNRWRREMMLERPDVTEIPIQRRHWGTLDAFFLARMRGNVHKKVVGETVPIEPTVKGYEPHTHLELNTWHESSFLGSSGAVATIGVWRMLYQGDGEAKPGTIGPKMRADLGVSADAGAEEIIEALRPKDQHDDRYGGVAALREHGLL